jgi:hypothetical protein
MRIDIAKTGGFTMKRLCMTAALIIVLLTATAQAGQFGPPEPEAQAGKVSFGLGYFYSAETLKPSNDTYIDQPNFWQKSTFVQNQAYIQGNYGFMKDWEIYGRLGGADLRSDEIFYYTNSKEDFRDNIQPFGTLGIRGVLYRSGIFAVGPFVQASYFFSDYKDSSSGVINGVNVFQSYTAKNMWDLNVGISAQAKYQGALFYVGPFFHMKRADAELQIRSATNFFSDSVTYKEDTYFGGFAGVRVPVTKNISLGLEGQYTNKVAAGASVSYSF